MYAYLNLDPSYPPSELMLQWYFIDENGNESWEHRAYWGDNALAWGVNGTASRHYMGPLPATGQWVGLEVKIVEGMAFTLYEGRAAWDRAGKITPDMDDDGLPDSWELQYFGIGN